MNIQQTSRMFLSVLLLAGMTHLHAATTQDWRFRVFLDDREIGRHVFQLSPRADGTHVAIEADFQVKFLFINAYEYAHRNHEIWQGACLKSIASQTNDNGDIHFVRGTLNEHTLDLQTQDGWQQLSGCIRTFAYWDPAMLDSTHLLNAQTGELLPVSVEKLGTVLIQVRDKSILTHHYRLVTEKFTIDLWYEADTREWVSLQTTTSDGNILRYQLI